MLCLCYFGIADKKNQMTRLGTADDALCFSFLFSHSIAEQVYFFSLFYGINLKTFIRCQNILRFDVVKFVVVFYRVVDIENSAVALYWILIKRNL